MRRPPSPSLPVLLLLLLGGPSVASPAATADAGAPAAGPEAAGGTVVSVEDGDSLTLADGRRVRLAAIDAPEPPPETADGAAPQGTPAAAAREALAALALGKRVTLATGAHPRDRYGRVLAQLTTGDGLWLQGELLRRGLARVHSFPDSRALVPQMLAIEAEARAAGRGGWALPAWRVLAPRQAADAVDSFQLVEGRVVGVGVRGGRTYVDFGADWRSDLSLSLDGRARRLCESVGLDPAALAGRRVRVRGWLRLSRGPLIEITHPEQIELLPP
ncbi:MAG: thermonuclease family protein [Dongiaceae bacterium]